MSFTRPSVQSELDRFFREISESPDHLDTISKSAFTQSRRNLKPEAFKELAASQLDYFIKNAPNKKSWKETRVVAIDGSYLNLPNSEELKEEFGFVTNQYEEIIKAECSFAYDVCNELILDAQIDRYNVSERDLAVKHLSFLNSKNDILVFDRGYPSQWLVGLLIQKGFKFCFRLGNRWESAFKSLDKESSDVDWQMVFKGSKGLRKLKEMGIPKLIDNLRLVAIELPSGEKEVLLTNLTDRETYTTRDMQKLYRLRWGVEESFKLLKKVLHLEYFTGKTTIAIKQDFYAKVFMQNMASMIRTQGVTTKNKKKTKHKYQLNKTQAIAKTKDFLISLFFGKNILKSIFNLLKIIKERREIIRPNRSNPRPDTGGRRRFKGLNSRGI